jgi:tight adherence protein B
MIPVSLALSPALLLALVPALLLTWVLAPPPRRALAPQRPARVRRAPTSPLDTARMVEQLASVISSGASIRQGWGALSRTLPEGDLRDLARASAAGADPSRAASGRLRGTPTVTSLGAALAVCERTGAPAAVMLQHLAEALRDLHDAAQARRSAFAGPRSTARILLVLPLAGLGLGMLLGGDPLRLLVASASGRLLGAAGIALTVLGWWWMRRLLRSADPPRRTEVDPSVVLELIAGALESGLPLSRALAAVGTALPVGKDAEAMRAVSTALAAGVPARLAVAALPTELDALGRSATLAEETGADLARVLRAAARDARRGRARDAEVRAAELAVRLVLPTGVALLPAFVALGIVPTVISLLGGALTLTSGGA